MQDILLDKDANSVADEIDFKINGTSNIVSARIR